MTITQYTCLCCGQPSPTQLCDPCVNTAPGLVPVYALDELASTEQLFGVEASSYEQFSQTTDICRCDLHSVIMPYGCQCGGK